MKYMIGLMESLPSRLQDITDGSGNHTKYYPEEIYTQ
jgi:hypothetical protein